MTQLQSDIIKSENIVFVCSGNIIRSAFAEILAKSFIVNKNISSLGTDYHNSRILNETKNALLARNIPLENIIGFRPTNIVDFKIKDLQKTIFFGMTAIHLKKIKSYFVDEINVYLLSEIIDENKEISDPYFTNNYDQVFSKIEQCINQLTKYCIN
ncbi:MAG: arsenate reductase/protein-tyrosine-phosphatase family protein [Candidatus Kariarchaeaceae archaeon]|jgi:protein-tyrosine-phosphatase